MNPRPTLYLFHRVLISFAIALGCVLLLYGASRFARTRDLWTLATGIGGAAACVALAWYLRWFSRKQIR